MPRNLALLAYICLMSSLFIGFAFDACDVKERSYDDFSYDGYDGYEAGSSNQLQKDLAEMGVTIDAPEAFDTSPGPIVYTKVTGEIRPTLAGKHDPTLVAFVNEIEVLDAEGVSIAELHRFGDGKFSIDVVRDFVGEEISLKVKAPHWNDHIILKKIIKSDQVDSIDFGSIDFAIDQFWPRNEYVYFKGEFSHPAKDKANLEGMGVALYPSSSIWRSVNDAEPVASYMHQSGAFWVAQERHEFFQDGWYMQDDRIPNVGYSYTEDRKSSMKVGKKHDGYFELSQIPYPGKLYSLEIEGVLPEPLRWHDQPASDSRSKALPSDFHHHLKPSVSQTTVTENSMSHHGSFASHPRWRGAGLWVAQKFDTSEEVLHVTANFHPVDANPFASRSNIFLDGLVSKNEVHNRVKVFLSRFMAIRAHDSNGNWLRNVCTDGFTRHETLTNVDFARKTHKLPPRTRYRPISPYLWESFMSYDPDDEVCLYWTQELRVVAKSFTSGVVAATLRDAWQDGGPPSSKPYRGFVEVTINRGGAYFPDDTLFALRVRNQDDRDSVYSFEPTQFPFRFGSAKQRVLRLNLHYGDRKQFCEVIEASGKAGFPNFVVSNRANIQLDDKGTSATLTLAAQAPYPSQSAREYAYRIQCGSSLIKPSFRFQEDKGFRKGKDAFYSTEFADLSAIVLQGQSFNRTSATDFEMHIQPNLEVRFTEGLRANFQILSLSSSNCAVMLTEQPASVEAWEVPNHKKPLISRVMRDGQYLYLKTDVVWKDGKGIAVIDEPQMYEVKGENRSLHWDLHNENHKCVGWDMTGGEIGTIKPGKHYWVGKFRDEVLYQSEPFEIGEEKITTITIPTLETTRAYELKAKAAKKKD